MLGVVLVDLGLALVLAGAIGVVHPIARLGMPTRPRVAAVAFAGALVAACGLLLPAPERRTTGADSRLDEVVPRWQFAERFRALAGPGYAKAMMSFRWGDEGAAGRAW